MDLEMRTGNSMGIDEARISTLTWEYAVPIAVRNRADRAQNAGAIVWLLVVSSALILVWVAPGPALTPYTGASAGAVACLVTLLTSWLRRIRRASDLATET
jgi:hypothetical protein